MAKQIGLKQLDIYSPSGFTRIFRMRCEMFIKQISIDNWSGVMNDEKVINSFNINDIYQYIRELNGNTKTLITLEGYNNECMGIGGGPNLFIVYVTFDNENFHTLLNGEPSYKLVELKTGGQFGEYPENYCNTIENVFKAVDTFINFGKLNSDFQWVSDN